MSACGHVWLPLNVPLVTLYVPIYNNADGCFSFLYYVFSLASILLSYRTIIQYCQDHVQLRTLVRSKDRLVRKYSCSTDPTRTSRTIPGPGLASCTYHLLSPYLTLDIFPY